jgi:hypothetical protein
MPLSALTSPEQPGATAADGGRRRPGWRREQIVWVFQVLFWLAVGATLCGFSVALRPDEPPPWGAIGLRVVTGFVVTSLIDMLFRLPALRALPRSQRWTLLVIVAVLGMAMSLATTLLLLGEGPMIQQTGMALAPFAPRLVAALMWCAIYLGIDLLDDIHESEMQFFQAAAAAAASENRAIQAESLARQHELRQLQEQMNPHFLFNALNAVAASKNDPAAVEQVTQDLSEYLRFALREAEALEPLSRELYALEKYLAVQQRRFGDNLVCRINADRVAPRVLVPPMLIQPLLENALHYGAQTSSMPLKVNVRAGVKDDWLEVVVANSGQWVVPDTTRSPGTGIRSLRRRLELLIDANATVEVQLDPDLDDGWVRIVIRMPANVRTPAADRAGEPA